MLTLLALMAQTVTLDTDPAKAAMACAVSVGAATSTEQKMRSTSRISYFVMRAAKADPGTKTFVDRVSELLDQAGAAAQAADSAEAVLPECYRRFPLAQATETPRLPADSFQRDVLCFSVLSLLRGAASGIEEDSGNAGPLDNIETVLAPISDRLTDSALKAHGIASEAGFVGAMGDQLSASLDIGNAETIARACGAAPF
jgi:hypothetical protein